METQNPTKEANTDAQCRVELLVVRLRESANESHVIQENPKQLLEDAANEIVDLHDKVKNMAVLMRMLLSDRQASRNAKKYLIDNDLMGSSLRGV